jgi:hypothetical protein
MQNTHTLVAQYTQTVQRTVNINLQRYNTTQAYVAHSIALQAFNTLYAAQTHNTTQCTCNVHVCKCSTSINLRYKVNCAITVAQTLQAAAQKHVSFNLQHALAVLQAYNSAAQ